MFDNENSPTDFDDIFREDTADAVMDDITAPDDMLTVAQAEAVRFYTRKKGYDFAQVEEFVHRVRTSLAFYEQALETIEKAYNEQAEDLHYKDSQVSQLRATIEVFRAKGDPMVNADGGFVTESQVKESAEYQSVVRDRQAVEAQVADLQAQVQVLTAELEAARSQQHLGGQEVMEDGLEDGMELGNEPVEEVEGVLLDETATFTTDATATDDDADDAAGEETDSHIPLPDTTPPADDATAKTVPGPVRPVPGLLAYAPEAHGHNLRQVPTETPVDSPAPASDRLTDAPEAQ